ncbi:MAG: TIGR03617 family F420-dependent LLM class oxidoreductase [Acidimicrobiia bacterium]
MLKVDVPLAKELDAVEDTARAAEAAGYDGIWTGESKSDPFLTCAIASRVTSRAILGTEIAIAFARTPMTLAQCGWDLQAYSHGRFVLGLGSQVKAHIERRFNMPWSSPAARMRELVLAMHAIWDAWEHGTKLDFRGDFYSNTLMTPYFTPHNHGYGRPPVFLAGVGRLMTEVAGEVCDGFFMHPFTTHRYLNEVTMPALAAGRAKRGKSLEGFEVGGPAFVTVGRDDAEMAVAVEGTKAQIAFYASTPAYRPVLEMHGWGEVSDECNRLTKEGRWAELGSVIPDEVLHAISIVGDPASVGKGLVDRYGDALTRLSLYSTYESDPAIWPEVVDAIRA